MALVYQKIPEIPEDIDENIFMVTYFNIILSEFDSSSIHLRHRHKEFEKCNDLYVLLFLYSCNTQINHMLA